MNLFDELKELNEELNGEVEIDDYLIPSSIYHIYTGSIGTSSTYVNGNPNWNQSNNNFD